MDLIGNVIVGVCGVAVVAYLPLQLWALARLRGYWRIAALAPAGIMGLLLVSAIAALQQGSNLWPILVIFASPPLCAALLALLGLERAVQRNDTSEL